MRGYVLDAGCGSGRFAHDLRERSPGVVGVDLTEKIASNRRVDFPVIGDLERLPLAAGSVSPCLCKYVLEHIARPAEFFGEVARVLEPGGVLIIHTPNICRYVTAIVRLTPPGFHRRINAARGRAEADTFPTLYRANSRAALGRFARGAGLAVVSMEMFESRPYYLVFSPLAYLAGIAYERLVNRFDFLAGLRVNIIAVPRKPPEAG